MTSAARRARLSLVRSDGASGEPPLVERGAELDALAGAIERATAGRGAAVVLEGAAGMGVTSLLDHGGRLAGAAGLALRRAAPGPLERELPYGLIRSLLEAPLRAASERDRRRLLDGPAAVAGRLLLDGETPDGAGDTMAVAHGVLWLCAGLAATQPLALIVDDAQWADRESLAVLSYLARRIEDMPAALVIGVRGDDPEAPIDLLSLLGGARAATVLRPRPLTIWGAVAVVRRHVPDAPVRVCRDAQRAARGNPWLLGLLAREIALRGPGLLAAEPRAAAGRGAGASDVREAPSMSPATRDIVRRRLAALTPRDRAAAAAFAVLGDAASPHHVAALAGVPLAELTPVRDALRAAGLLTPNGTRFAHRLIGAAVIDDLARSARERLHREAARTLAATGAPSDAVAAHLLRCAPQGDPEVGGLLLGAAEQAAERGAPLAAAAYLDRALQERADGEDRGALLARLAAVAFDARVPDLPRRLREWLAELDAPAHRTDVLTHVAGLAVLTGGEPDIPDRLDAEQSAGAGAGLAAALDAAALDALVALPDRRRHHARRLAALGRPSDPVLARVAAAHRAWAWLETESADACAALASEALSGDVLLREFPRRAAYLLAVRTLIATDRHAEARIAIDALADAATARGSLRLRAVAAWHAGELALRTGDLTGAEREARLVLDLADGDLPVVAGGARALLVQVLAERGAIDDAVKLLDGLDARLRDRLVGARAARARLWLAAGDFERARAEACEAGARHQWPEWRATAALALAHLGRRDHAAALAGDELARAERFGAPIPLIVALHACAVAERDPAAKAALCRRALDVAAPVTATLDTVRVRLELGGALARAGSRSGAREQLRPALAEADAAGAAPLAGRARRELVATGLRPRQAALEGHAALTPRQREICRLAATGKTNREIAQALFLSLKTVETHLAAGYRKLRIGSRGELAAALATASR